MLRRYCYALKKEENELAKTKITQLILIGILLSQGNVCCVQETDNDTETEYQRQINTATAGADEMRRAYKNLRIHIATRKMTQFRVNRKNDRIKDVTRLAAAAATASGQMRCRDNCKQTHHTVLVALTPCESHRELVKPQGTYSMWVSQRTREDSRHLLYVSLTENSWRLKTLTPCESHRELVKTQDTYSMWVSQRTREASSFSACSHNRIWVGTTAPPSTLIVDS